MKFNIVANGKMKINANILEMAKRRAKWGEIWGLGVLVVHIWDNFDLVIFQGLLGGHLMHLRFTENTIFKSLCHLNLWFFFSQTFYICFLWQSTQKSVLLRCFFYTFDSFSTTFLLVFAVTVHTTVISWNLKKQCLNLTLWPNIKWNIGNIWGMANHRARGSEIWTHGDW